MLLTLDVLPLFKTLKAFILAIPTQQAANKYQMMAIIHLCLC